MANYSIENLRNGIKQASKNIKTFEDAIEKERATIKEFEYMIETIERKEQLKNGVTVNGDNNNSISEP